MHKIIKNSFATIQKVAIATLCAAFFLASGCAQNPDLGGDEPFFFYEGENIPLKQVQNKIFVQSISFSYGLEFDEKQWNALIKSNASLRQSNDMRWERGSFYWVVLETKDGKPIPPTTIEYFKASPVVVTVSHPLEAEHSGVMQGLTNDFVVKLKETASYTQLEQLAEQNHCTVEEKGRYLYQDEDLIWVTVSKISKLNTMQMSDLFFETGLFETVQPNFVILNVPGVFCDAKTIVKVLENEPAIIQKKCFQHVGRVDAFYFELENMHSDFFSLTGIFPLDEIPKQYRKEGLSVNISGNVISCVVTGGCIEPNIRLASIPLFELKSIKIKNQ